METNEIRQTKFFVEGVNQRARAIGFPELIISDGSVYKDELHRILRIGIKLEEEP